jgi:Fic family protein
LEAVIPTPQWTTVRRRWPGDPGAPGGRANRVGFHYEAYVPGEIAAWQPALPAYLAADAGRAEASIRELRRHGPALGSLAWPLLRAEAIASSRIEGLSVDHHRLALADLPGRDDPVARSVRGNLDALRRALDLSAAPVTVASLLEIHRRLLGETAAAAIAGRLRDRQNWIASRHGNPRGAAFVPPPEGEVPRLLDDLCRFCERDDVPPSLQAAIAHVQFETIHPFADGNGRVGRALIHVLLSRRGLLGAPGGDVLFPPVSLVLADRAEAYVAALTAFRAGDDWGWLEFFTDVLHRAVGLAEELAVRVVALQARWRGRAGGPRRDSAAEALIARLPERPVLDIAQATELTGASREATRRAVNRLVEAGVIRDISGRRRGRSWEAVGLFALLDGLEAETRPAPTRRPRRRPPGSQW